MNQLPPLLLMLVVLAAMFWGVAHLNGILDEKRQACEARTCVHGQARVISDTCVCVEVPK